MLTFRKQNAKVVQRDHVQTEKLQKKLKKSFSTLYSDMHLDINHILIRNFNKFL